jgi:hypothetical protein
MLESWPSLAEKDHYRTPFGFSSADENVRKSNNSADDRLTTQGERYH